MTTGGGCRSRGDYDNDANGNNGVGQGGSSGGEGRRCRRNNRHWLMHPDKSKGVILGAFRMLPNDAVLNGAGTALHHPVVKMSCTAI